MDNSELEIKKILVPIDFSGNSTMLLRKANNMAKELGAELHILHVVESLDPYMGFAVPHISLDSLGKDLNTHAEKKMEQFLEETIPTNAAPLQAKVIAGNDAAAEIIRYAEENDCHLILIATQGFKGLPKFLFGSVAERVLKQAHCPVMTIKPR